MSDVGFVGADISAGQMYRGVDQAPALLRQYGLFKKFWEASLKHRDYGDCFGSYSTLYDKMLSSAESNSLSVSVGGDHSLSLSTITALKRVYSNLKIIWVDAHGDINTPQTSPTGNLHGMPLAGLLGLMNIKDSFGWRWFEPLVKPEDLTLIGVRSLDEGEQEIISRLGIKTYSTLDVRERGMNQILNEVAITQANAPVHLSFDVDSLDPSILSATGVCVDEGLNLTDLNQLIDEVKTWQKLVSFEIVEFNPLLAKEPQDIFFGLELISQMTLQLSQRLQDTLTEPRFYGWQPPTEKNRARLCAGA